MENAITEEKILTADDTVCNRILNLAEEVGAALLSYGGSVSRVETAIERICAAYGAAEVNVFAIPSMIVSCIRLADGTEYTQMKRVYSISNNLAMLEKYNQLSRDICKDKYPIEEAEQKLKNLKSCLPSNRHATVLGGAILAGAFNVYFGGSLWDFIPAFFIGALMAYLNGVFSARAFNGYACAFTLSVIGGVLSVLSCWLLNIIGVSCHTDMVMIGTIMIVVPGLLICNAVRDLFCGDLISGTLQILNGVLITLAIAAGYGLAIFIFQDITFFIEAPLRDYGTIEYFIYVIIFCMIGSFGVSVWFNLSFKRMGWAMLNTIITFGVYLLMEYFTAKNLFLTYLVATLVASAVAEILARAVKSPATVFLIPAIIPFVPGASLYYTMSYLVSGDMQMMLSKGTDTALCFLGMAVGLSVVAMVFQFFFPVKSKINMQHKLRFTHKKN